jgi:hypothetical protein
MPEVDACSNNRIKSLSQAVRADPAGLNRKNVVGGPTLIQR